MNQPTVSVIIPTYNHARFIGTCLDRVLKQDYPVSEILVVDDGSTDETEKLVQTFGDRVRYHRQENQGQAVARAWGLRQVDSDLVCLLDSDDYWEPGFLASAIPQFENSRLGIAFANHDRVNTEGKAFEPNVFQNERDWILPFVSKGGPGEWTILDETATSQLYFSHFPHTPSGAVFRRSLLKHFPDPKQKRGDDYLFFMNYLIESRCETAFTMDVLWHLRTHDRNIRQLGKNQDLLFKSDIRAKRELLKKHANQINPQEVSMLRRLIASDLFDWGYSYRQRKKLTKAASKYLAACKWDRGGPITRKSLLGLPGLLLSVFR